MGDAAESVAIAVLEGLVKALPSFGEWLGRLLDGEAEPSAFSRRVRDILPVRGASREAADELAKENDHG